MSGANITQPSAGQPPTGLTAIALMSGLGWVYDKVVGLPEPGGGNGPALCTDAEIDRKIRLYCASAGAAGFITNVGGAFTLPIALPANLVSVAALQLRLITDIAACRGYDVHGQEVRAAAIACLAGNAALKVFKDAGIRIGARLGERVLSQLSGTVLARINQAVGARLLARAGSQGFVNVAKFIPLMGGVVGGGIDVISTKAAGEIAKRVFTRIASPTSEPPAPEPLRIAAP